MFAIELRVSGDSELWDLAAGTIGGSVGSALEAAGTATGAEWLPQQAMLTSAGAANPIAFRITFGNAGAPSER